MFHVDVLPGASVMAQQLIGLKVVEMLQVGSPTFPKMTIIPMTLLNPVPHCCSLYIQWNKTYLTLKIKRYICDLVFTLIMT